MNDHDRAERERRCLDEARRSLGAPGDPWLERYSARLRDVRLDGRYPDTRVIVELDDLRPTGKDGRVIVSEPVWDPSGFSEPSLFASVIEACSRG